MKQRFKVIMLCLLLCAGAMLGLVGNLAKHNSSVQATAQSLKILGIGDTFTEDSLALVYEAAVAAGVEDVTVGIVYRTTDTTIASHVGYATQNSFQYSLALYEDGEKTIKSNMSIANALALDSWDYVVLQQSRALAGAEANYSKSHIDSLKSAVDAVMTDPLNTNQNPNYKLAWLMNWADFGETVLSAYESQAGMYEAIASAVEASFVPDGALDAVDLVVPVGTAIQNMRTSFCGDSLNRDAYRLSLGLGRFTAAVVVLKALGIDVGAISRVPETEDVSEFYLPAIVESAVNACQKPYEVTPSAHIQPPFDLAKYNLMDCGLQAWGYWNAVSDRHFMRITQDSDSRYWISSVERFGREQLPVGAIIEVKSGYRYVPEAWSGNSRQPADSKSPYVSTRFVQITEEWWGDSTMRAFNITTLITNTQTFETQDGIEEYLKVYIPKSADNYITRLEAGNRVGRINGTSISVVMPPDTDLTSVRVTIQSSAKSTVAPTTAQWDLSAPVSIAVTAENGDVRTYTLTATLEVDDEPNVVDEPKGCGASVSVQAMGAMIAALALCMVMLTKKLSS